ncbi:uncharacterized protein BDV17DRAFT_256756 [Aspergillus undulatus]|uniref:uncharacterized protein n=1 Tax=Aspergillus undulatus TaxID=1810928 RepID=UPI003CCE1412
MGILHRLPSWGHRQFSSDQQHDSMSSQQTLLAVLPFPEPEEFMAHIQEKLAQLNVIWVHRSYGVTNFDAAEQLDPVTILATLSAISTPEQSPNLKFIQLLPGGVDHLPHERIF